MTGRYILDDQHRAIEEPDLMTWVQWFENDKRRVAWDEIDGVKVSTVFLGLDHNFGANSVPILFETMVFGGPMDGEADRYATWDEAVAGHQAMVDRVMNARD
jgi:hypothetical protein